MPDPVIDAMRQQIETLRRQVGRLLTTEYSGKAGDADTLDGLHAAELGSANVVTASLTSGAATTNSGNFVTTGLALTITIAASSKVLLWFEGVHSSNSATGQAYFDIHDSVAGALISGNTNGLATAVGTVQQMVNMHVVHAAPATGAHTYTVYWKVVNVGTTSTLQGATGNWTARLTAMELKA